ncbi:MAG: SPOR domain-containing protein [Candidatus Krumholzibacteria bacterium]|nr:SPOR domain-containing protein [Candidatus Krumholzibacteria bacterium]
MTGEDRGYAKNDSCEAAGGGYTIFLDEERIRAFMAAGDPSSASELDHFNDVGAQFEKRIKERSGAVILALSAGEKGISRDFAVLQIAHIIAKHGKNVLIVDGDFLHSGLSGLVENVEEHGFLDLLLYGSSLKTVTRAVGIEGVSVAGPGSFPVSRTIPFAMKEFEKIMDFLRTKHDVIIYCSTLYTEDAKINPLARLVDGILLCCRIDDMSDGELQKNIKALGEEKVPPVELVCFCGKRAQAPVPVSKKALEPTGGVPTIAAPKETPAGRDEPLAIPLIEKAEDLEPLGGIEPERKPRLSVLRVVSIAAAILILAFVVWWVVLNRTVREKEPLGTTPGEVARTSDGASSPAKDSTTVPAESIAASAPDSARAIPPSGTAETAARTEPKTADAAGTEIAPGRGVYTIHVASFRETSRADVEKAYLDKNGFPARIVEVDIKGEKWLRVLVGEFATEGEATKTRLDLLGLNKIGYARVVTIEAATR